MLVILKAMKFHNIYKIQFFLETDEINFNPKLNVPNFVMHVNLIRLRKSINLIILESKLIQKYFVLWIACTVNARNTFEDNFLINFS